MNSRDKVSFSFYMMGFLLIVIGGIDTNVLFFLIGLAILVFSYRDGGPHGHME